MAYQPLDVGRLDKLVTIQSVTRADDDGGGATITYTPIGAWHVGIDTEGGREVVRAQQVMPQVTHLVRGRFRTDVTAKHRLFYVSNNTSRVFAIHAVVDTEERHEQLVCWCSEVMP